LETVEGEPAEPPTLSAAVPDWKAGHTIHIGSRTLRVVGIRDDDVDKPLILVVRTWPKKRLAAWPDVP
jgi:hypothetical protein